MPYSKLHAAATEYALAGWPVFPLQPGQKIPIGGSNGVKDATTNLTIIDAWWQANPDANIGFCPEGAGMCVIDIDGQPGMDNWQEFQADAECSLIVRTPNGWHRYYAGSLPPTASRIAPKIDTRGRNSYVLIPPSVVDGKEYRFAASLFGDCLPDSWELKPIPNWVVEKCSKIAEPRDRPETIKTEVTDRPQAIALFKRYLERNPIPPEGESSDDACYRAVSRGRDLGLSDDTIVGFLGLVTDFDNEWIEEKLANAERYQQNEPGCDTPETGQEKFGGLAAAALPPSGSEQGSTEAQDQSWVPHDPRNPEDMPELEYFDGN